MVVCISSGRTFKLLFKQFLPTQWVSAQVLPACKESMNKVQIFHVSRDSFFQEKS